LKSSCLWKWLCRWSYRYMSWDELSYWSVWVFLGFWNARDTLACWNVSVTWGLRLTFITTLKVSHGRHVHPFKLIPFWNLLACEVRDLRQQMFA
jgi:hypothetical protein